MKVNRIDTPYPAVYVDDFIPSPSLVRAAVESFDEVDDWVKYGGEDTDQVQWCNRLGRENITSTVLILMDYMVTYFDPNKIFGLTENAFPDTEYYGGGMMLTPNKNGEGGYLGMHVDATSHGTNKNWKREYSVLLGLSEEYDSSFDLLVHNGKEHGRISYKFNRVYAFKCSENSWHGLPEITRGLDKKTLGVMYWSKISDEERDIVEIKAKFNDNLEFN